MIGMRSRTDHQSRLDWWHRQIQRQPRTKLTVVNFCRQLGVSVPTFYYWKRRVQAEPGAFVQPVAKASLLRPTTAPDVPFLPVSIVDPDVGTHLEIELANTCVGTDQEFSASFDRLESAAQRAVGPRVSPSRADF